MSPHTLLRRDGGFTLATVMMAMLVVMTLTVAAFGAAESDIRIGHRNVDAKRAYAAAEAGVAYYLGKLGQDNDYWTRCTNDTNLDPAANPVNQPWDGTGTDPRRWKALPDDPAEPRPAEFTIELLPRKAPTCVENDNESMINPGDGTLHIRTTGRSNGVYRSVVVTLRRNGFLDYLYFTDFETSDPLQQPIAQPTFSYDGRTFWSGVQIRRAASDTTNDTIAGWADQDTACRQWWRPTSTTPGRETGGTYAGVAYYDLDAGGSGWSVGWYPTSWFGGLNITCSRIQFANADVINGPFHTNDTMRICGTPTFGRPGMADLVEYYAWLPNCSPASPKFGNSRQKTGTALRTLALPASNARLKETTFSPYIFTGKTTFVINDTQMTVTRADGSTSTMSLPANGLVYVRNDPVVACPQFDPANPYADDPGCGDALVQGTYGKSLTIAAERDILITQSVTGVSGKDALLGLIANNYVRVKHTVATQPCNSGTADSPAGPQNRTIEAAILSLGHVFTVDNYQCGDPLGTLTVKGAIAQRYRGPVGTSGGSGAATGYIKDYNYDDRLKYRSPPYFITPVEASWRIMRSSEQTPAVRPAT